MNKVFKILAVAIVSFYLLPVKANEPCSTEALYENLPFQMSPITVPVFPELAVTITDFGAKADGKTLCSKSINQAIRHVHEQGGGKVIIPAGLWITGPIELLSNVNLHAEKNALVLFSADHSLYPFVDTSFEGEKSRRCQSPLWARNQKNIAITGEGVFDGNGDTWRPVKKGKMTEGQWKSLLESGGLVDSGDVWYPSEGALKGSKTDFKNLKSEADWDEIRDFLRPVLLSFISCEGVLLEGVTFRNSPGWCLHPMLCKDVIIDNVFVFNPWYAQNGDALDLESCDRALVINSTFDAGDDAICIKSGKDEYGRERGVPCSNVVIYQNVVLHGHGGFVVGSEMSGGVENIYVDKCTFIGTDVGIRFKSTRGRGGEVKNIHINNIDMVNIAGDALIFDLYYGNKIKGKVEKIPVNEETPIFRDIYIKNILCDGSKRAMFFNGIPEMPIQNINLENIRMLRAGEGAVFNQSENITLKGLVIETRNNTPAVTLMNVSNVIIDDKQIVEVGEELQVMELTR